MIIIAIIGIAMLSFFIFLSLAYKRKERKRIDKKTHKGRFVYGLAMFVVDRLPKKMVQNNQRVHSAMKELVVKENVEKEKYLYIVEKVAMCIVALWITLFLVLVVSISEKTDAQGVSTVLRNEKTDQEYHLQIENDAGKKEQVTINVSKKQYTKARIEKIFDDRRRELIKQVLGENKSPDRVTHNLNLVSEIGKERISVTWSISDSDKIEYDGTLSGNIAKEGEIVTLTATMRLGKNTRDYSFAVNIFPAEQKGGMGEKLQEYVNENAIYQEKVKLPEEIDGQKVRYQNIVSKMSGYVLIIGMIVSIALFFLKDADLKKEVEKRNQQLRNDYPGIVSKILLYYGAGLSVQKTIERIVKGYEEEKKRDRKLYRYAYEELSMCLIRMKSGVSEMAAMNQYGERCKLHCYVKLAGLIEQNMRRGTKELSLVLKSELREAMIEKKNRMLKNGGQISTKLLGPMVMMLIISIVIIMVPAFLSMEF